MLLDCCMFCFFIFIYFIIKFFDKFLLISKIILAFDGIRNNFPGINDQNWCKTDKSCDPPIEIDKVW